MSAGALDIVAEQGATFALALLWTDTTDVPIDLTGYAARMHVRNVPNASTFVIELTTENGRIALGATAGTINLLIDAETTAALPAGEFVYDIELVQAGDGVTRLLEGAFSIRAEVTRP